MRYVTGTLGRILMLSAGVIALLAVDSRSAAAQWSTTYEQFYLPGSFNWEFRRSYPAADKLFNAFDYGHAILYERLYTQPNAPASVLEEKEYDFITRKLLRNPPRVPLEEAAIEVQYAKLAPEAKMMFEWAHLLHRQIYDVWADERLNVAEKDRLVGDLLSYYRSRKDLAFSTVPKTMDLMEGQYYATAFRERYPKFNGLIWAYHWLQVGLYEPLIRGESSAERQTGVVAAVARFWQMLESPPDGMPVIMPMTAAISPAFAERYPDAAIIFDNLHSMHDVISDILASPKVPRNRKRAEILKAAGRYRDDTSFVMTRAEARRWISCPIFRPRLWLAVPSTPEITARMLPRQLQHPPPRRLLTCMARHPRLPSRRHTRMAIRRRPGRRWPGWTTAQCTRKPSRLTR